MEQRQFIQNMITALTEQMKTEYGIKVTPEITTILKNNVERESLTIRADVSSIAPTIPIAPMYSEYLSGAQISPAACL